MTLSNTQYEALLQLADVGIWRFNAKLNTWQANRVCCKLLQLDGRNPDLDQLHSNIIAADKNDYSAMMSAIHQKQTTMEFSLRFQFSQAATVRWYTFKLLLLSDGGQELVGTVTESPQEHQLQQQLQREKLTSQMALKASKSGVWSVIYNAKGIRQGEWRFDKLSRDILHLDNVQQTVSRQWFFNLGEKKTSWITTHFEKAIQEQLEIDFEFSFRSPQRELKFIRMLGTVTRDDHSNQPRIDGLIRDITLEKMSKNELEKLSSTLESQVCQRTKALEDARQKAEEASTAKGNFLAMMSHELRTPMNAIVGSLDLLGLEVMSFEQQELVDTTKSSAINLINILNDILDFSKIEAGKIELENIPINLNEIVDNVVDVFLPVAANKRVKLNVFESADLPRLVEADPTRLRQILYNLLSNAVKFCHQHNQDDDAEVSIHIRPELGEQYIQHISFAVTDNGIGMDQQTIGALFTPFKQAEKSTQRRFGGTGLGLSICGSLIELMGGSIEIDSTPDVGSTFTVNLPFWLNNQSPVEGEQKYLGITLACNLIDFRADLKASQLLASVHNENPLINDISQHLENPEASLDCVMLRVESQQEWLSWLEALQQLKCSPPILVCADKVDDIDTKLCKQPVVVHNLASLTLNKLHKSLFQLLTAITMEDLGDNFNLDLDLELDLDLDIEPLAPALKTAPSESESEPKSSELILVVEDNPVNQKLFAKQLEKLNYCFVMANDGVEGLAAWQQCQPQLILADCHMPNLNGYDMSSKIREIEQQTEAVDAVPIIAVTGAVLPEDRAKCTAAGMNDVLSKPLQLKELEKGIAKWLPPSD